MLKNRESRPKAAEEYKFLVPDIERISLPNGFNILLVERRNLPILRMNLMAGCGSRKDPPGKKGLANLFAMCIDEGAGEYDALQLSSEFDLIGSDFDIHSTNDCTYFLSRMLKENLERTFELFSTVLLKPHFSKEEFLKEKRKVVTRILQTQDDSDEIASNAFEYLIYGRNHPYAFPVIGRRSDIESIAIEDLTNFYSTCLLPGDSTMFVVGDISYGETRDLVNKYFGNWNSGKKVFGGTDPLTQNLPGIYLIDKPGSVQAEIRVGHLTEKRNDTNYFPRLLLNMTLGGQFSSRININLRENKGYTYGAFSNFNFFRDSGYFFVSTSVNIENTFSALQEIFKELDSIRNGVTGEELLFSKTSLMRKFPSNFETNGQIASSLSRLILYNMPDEHFKNYIQQIYNVSIEQVNQAAKDYIFPDKLTVLLVGDKKKLLKQFEKSVIPVELDLNGDPL